MLYAQCPHVHMFRVYFLILFANCFSARYDPLYPEMSVEVHYFGISVHLYHMLGEYCLPQTVYLLSVTLVMYHEGVYLCTAWGIYSWGNLTSHRWKCLPAWTLGSLHPKWAWHHKHPLNGLDCTISICLQFMSCW